jgi:putative endonuclease
MKELTVYILKCADDSYYTGLTNNIERRLLEHNEGKYPLSYTAIRNPVTLVWQNTFKSKYEAIHWEKKIKGWTRLKKEALITGKYSLLHDLSVCKNETHYSNKVSCSTPHHASTWHHASTPLSMTDGST